MDDSSPRLVVNAEDGSVLLQLGGPAVTVDGIGGELTFERITPEGESTLALWLDAGQADVLAKMIRYILERVKITEESKLRLADLLPRVEALAAQHGAG